MQPGAAALPARSRLVQWDQPTPLLLPPLSVGVVLPRDSACCQGWLTGCWGAKAAGAALPPEFMVL